MEKAVLARKMDRLIKDVIGMIKNMEKESIVIIMGKFTKEIGKMINMKDWERIVGLTERLIMGNLKMVK
jgi:hypothetical protein